MISSTSTPEVKDASRNIDGGLFRTVLAGPGRTLADAFASLEQASHVEDLHRHPQRDLLGARVTLTPQEGEGYWELTRIRHDFYIIIENFAYKKPRIELVPGDGLVQFNFRVSGDMTLSPDQAEPLRFNRPSLLVWSQPMGVDISEWTAPSAHERNVAISVRPEYLVDNFLNSPVDVPERLKAFLSPDKQRVDYCQMPLTSQMFDAVNRLINNPFKRGRALVYTEALVLELLCGAIDTFCLLASESAEEYSDRELRCLHAARDILMRQFAPVPTVRQLARSLGIAETALRLGFTSVFGETMFDFSVRCRMQHALSLLREHRWPVERVAEAVGYAHATSFATAFRRHFDMRPIDVRGVKQR